MVMSGLCVGDRGICSLIAGFDPRPWEEHSPSFATPSAAEWEEALRQAKAAAEANLFGFPVTQGGHHTVIPAVTIYAWNEFGEGGILAPTRGQGTMLLDTVAKVFRSVRAMP
eukprot:m.571176 g.571176  ORF g.571176 m.571176 type:complete len:112 (-) comp22265_c1_seq42:266-601(-)